MIIQKQVSYVKFKWNHLGWNIILQPTKLHKREASCLITYQQYILKHLLSMILKSSELITHPIIAVTYTTVFFQFHNNKNNCTTKHSHGTVNIITVPMWSLCHSCYPPCNVDATSFINHQHSLFIQELV